MTIEEAIAHAKEQTEIFAGKHRVFLYLAIDALERNMPKKPTPEEEQLSRLLTVYVCPVCGQRIAGRGISKFCYECGQVLDWQEVE